MLSILMFFGTRKSRAPSADSVARRGGASGHERETRKQYLAFLADHGLEPRAIPPDTDTIRAVEIQRLKALSKVSGDKLSLIG